MIWHSRLAVFFIVIAIALALYLPFLSRNYDINGLTEAAALRAGRPGDLFTPNHMLYRPIGHEIQNALLALDWKVGTVPLLQVLSAIFGAIGAGFAYLMLTRISDRKIAFWISLTLAVSWSYWTLSTDVFYFSLAAMFVTAAAAVFVSAESLGAFAVTGILCGLSILACQANVFLLPGMALALIVRDPAQRFVKVLQRVVVLGGTATALVGGVFLAAGIWVYERRTPAALLEWGSSYSSNPLPMWGAWTPGRLVVIAGSAFKSVIGTDLWMFRVFHRFLRNGDLPGWVAPTALVALMGLLVMAYRLGTPSKKNDGRTAFGLLLLYAAYLPFILWWEPMEPRWFMLNNVFLAGIVAIVATRWSSSRRFNLALPAIFLAVAGMNFVTSAAPKRFIASVPTQTAACVAGHMKEADLFLATEWNWAGYIDLVHNRRVLNFIIEEARTGDKNQAMADISKTVAATQQQGGNVFMMDFKVYPPEYMKWLNEQTKFTADDLSKYSGDPAFDCAYGSFFRLTRADGVQKKD